MNKADVENIKTAAINEALGRAVGNALWQARQAMEKAQIDNLKHFTREMKKAREYADLATELYKERRQAWNSRPETSKSDSHGM